MVHVQEGHLVVLLPQYEEDLRMQRGGDEDKTGAVL